LTKTLTDISPADRRSAIRFILCMGLVSLFAAMTYEGAHGTIGPLMTDLGASVTAVAIIAGLGEMLAASLRFFSGRLADRTHAYWTLAIAGYVVNMLSILSPYGAEEKQALLEARDLRARAEALVALAEMELASRDDGSGTSIQ